MAQDIKIDGYNSQAAPVQPPRAAEFDKGATDMAGIQEAIDARLDHTRALAKYGEKFSPNDAMDKLVD